MRIPPRSNHRHKGWTLAWIAFFALNLTLSAAFCKELRSAQPGSATRAEMGLAGLPVGTTGDARPRGRHAVSGRPSGSANHEYPAGQDATGDCEFCLLAGLADTSTNLLLAVPAGQRTSDTALPESAPRAALPRSRPIRAPPLV